MPRRSSLALPRLALPVVVTLGCLALSATASPQASIDIRGSQAGGAVLASGPVDGGGPLDLTPPAEALLPPALPTDPALPAAVDPTLAAPTPGDSVAGSGGTSGAASAVPAVSVDGASGIPGKVLAAYQAASASIAADAPSCHLPWQVLAGIGQVESGHARGGSLDENGRTTAPILGPVLDGSPGVAAIRDTDNGKWDGDTVWDRAVGPMQFIPGSWRTHGADGNRDGVQDPSNMFDAAKASAGYLCSGGRDLRKADDLRQAVFGYNHSWDYVATVLAWANVYTQGGVVATASTGSTGGSTPTASAAPGGGRDNTGARRKPSGGSTGKPTPGSTPSGSSTGTSSGSASPTTGSTPAGTPTLPPPTSLPPTASPTPSSPPSTPTTPTDPAPTGPTPTPTPTCPTPPVDPTLPVPTPTPTPPADPTAPVDPCAVTPTPTPPVPPTTPAAPPAGVTDPGTTPAGAIPQLAPDAAANSAP